MTDYRTLLADELRTSFMSIDTNDLAIADAALATRVPWLCPDCKGSGWAGCSIHTAENGWEPHRHHCQSPCTHPNSPTIADLLQKGAWYDNLKRQYDQAVLALMDAESRLAALRGEGQ